MMPLRQRPATPDPESKRTIIINLNEPPAPGAPSPRPGAPSGPDRLHVIRCHPAPLGPFRATVCAVGGLRRGGGGGARRGRDLELRDSLSSKLSAEQPTESHWYRDATGMSAEVAGAAVSARARAEPESRPPPGPGRAGAAPGAAWRSGGQSHGRSPGGYRDGLGPIRVITTEQDV